jgi:hypothetical protein
LEGLVVMAVVHLGNVAQVVEELECKCTWCVVLGENNNIKLIGLESVGEGFKD